ISSTRFVELSQKIESLFPTEKAEFWYVTGKTNTVTDEKVKGTLQWRYEFWRGVLLKSHVTTNARGKKRKHSLSVAPVHLAKYEDFEENFPDEIQSKVEWLKQNFDPADTVNQLWKDTSKFRVKQLIESEDLDASLYLSMFPSLTHPGNGLKLIKIDYNTLYPAENDSSTLNEYKIFQNEIFAFAKSKKKLDKSIKEKLKDIENTANEGFRSAIIFSILPAFVPVPLKVFSEQKDYKLERAETANEFILHAKDEEELEIKLDDRKKNLKKQKLFEAPIVVLVGLSLNEIEKYYVVISMT
ncbi:hypothetical protein HCN44_000472, partial [Aphidius gifuensis]